MRIILRQKSGLGNQLFQYAAGLFFAQRYGAQLEIIRESEDRAVSFGHPRPFLLSKFSIATNARERNRLDQLLCSTASYKAALAKSARLITGTKLYKPHFMEDWVFIPDLPVTSSTRRIYLDGYFQAHHYAGGAEDRLRRELIVRDAAIAKNRETLHQIHSSRFPVSLHVRRGDYTKIYGGRDALPISYYANAIEAVQAAVAEPIFFVFSDDIAFCRENLPAGPHYIFVDHNNQTEAHEDLRLMSSCRHHIIANSSFSWWGAWLNSDPAKMVIAPDRWLDPNVPHTDLLPPTWRRISTGATKTAPSTN